MRVVVLGINHRTAGIELRERVALQGPRLERALDAFRGLYPQAEAVILSTCNRTEVYVARRSHAEPTREQLTSLLAEPAGLDPAELAAATAYHDDADAVSHLFRVCAGLDSMVLGEPQILGQVKRAYAAAAARGAVGPALHRVFQQGMAAAKRARSQTGIDAGRVSVGAVAVGFARRIFDRFDDKVVVGIGAGDLAKLTLRHLRELRPAELWIANRSPDRAHRLAGALGIGEGTVQADNGDDDGRDHFSDHARGAGDPGGARDRFRGRGGVRSFAALDELLVAADIVLTATGAVEPIITAARFRPLLRARRSRPLFVIDLALPRDVEPAVGELENVFLYNLDDLQGVVAEARAGRGEEIARCEALLGEAVRRCLAEVNHRDVGRLVRALRHRLHEIGDAERRRTLRKLAAGGGAAGGGVGAGLDALLEEHTHRLVNKVLHLPLRQLDRRNDDTALSFYASALRALFDLPDDASSPAAELDAPAAVAEPHRDEAELRRVGAELAPPPPAVARAVRPRVSVEPA